MHTLLIPMPVTHKEDEKILIEFKKKFRNEIWK